MLSGKSIMGWHWFETLDQDQTLLLDSQKIYTRLLYMKLAFKLIFRGVKHNTI